MPPTGTCNKCGKKYTGWALEQEEHRRCDKIIGRHGEKCNGEIILDILDERDEGFVPVA